MGICKVDLDNGVSLGDAERTVYECLLNRQSWVDGYRKVCM
jgi:hypothetical protein